jgi:hypothetical protein
MISGKGRRHHNFPYTNSSYRSRYHRFPTGSVIATVAKDTTIHSSSRVFTTKLWKEADFKISYEVLPGSSTRPQKLFASTIHEYKIYIDII